jgi:branched-chain amino acid transport system substrate-binding protein
MSPGKAIWRGATLAAEQINAEGGILGRNITIVAEDDDSLTPPSDVAVIIAMGYGPTITIPYQDICSESKKIIITVGAQFDQFTQRVLDDYGKYKYYFRTFPVNSSAVSKLLLDDVVAVGNYTGFSKVALLLEDSIPAKQAAAELNKTLPNHGFQIVYSNSFTATTDFTSYLAAIEAAGAEILVPYIRLQTAIPFVKEWHDRQSPFVVWGVLSYAESNDFWNLTEGKCDTVSFPGSPAVAGYLLTNKTVPTREAYIQRWGEVPTSMGIAAFDTLRFILADALKRAGTTETEAVIKALETTNVETSSARHFVFTCSHDVMVGTGDPNNPAEDYMCMCVFQWQNGTQVPVSPEQIMKDAGATYQFPPWPGPWGNKQTP